jgi:hypothetical protein
MTPLNRATKGMLTMFALAGIVTLSSCSKDDDDNTTVHPDASVKIVNAFPNAGSVDVYNGDKINSSAIAYGEATNYINVAKGSATLVFKTGNGNTVLSKPVDFKGGSYSLFATGTIDDNQAVGVFAEDNLDAPASGKAKIRLVHVSPDAPTVNFVVNDSTYDASVTYQKTTAFKELTAGTYTIKLNNSASGETAITKQNVVLQAGKIYTFVAQGLVNNTPIVEQGFSLNVLQNN